MAEKSRGVTLTIFALLFALLAISDFAKPFSHSEGVGFVFLGTMLTGTANAVMGPLFGIFLLVYAWSIWAMRKYALQLSYIFVLWVLLNMTMYTARNHGGTQSSAAAIGSLIVGIGIPLATAIMLRRRQADLA